MSMTFTIAGDVPADVELDENQLNLSNVNAVDLLRWLDLPAEPCGEVAAREVAARCRRRLWDVSRNHDPEVPAVTEGRAHHFGRRPGYLRDRTRELLALAERAGDGSIRWY